MASIDETQEIPNIQKEDLLEERVSVMCINKGRGKPQALPVDGRYMCCNPRRKGCKYLQETDSSHSCLYYSAEDSAKEDV